MMITGAEVGVVGEEEDVDAGTTVLSLWTLGGLEDLETITAAQVPQVRRVDGNNRNRFTESLTLF